MQSDINTVDILSHWHH